MITTSQSSYTFLDLKKHLGLPLIIFLLAMSFQQGRLDAQTSDGEILGTVRDQTGSVMPNVTITVRNVGTNLSRTSVTGSDGNYEVRALPVGTYSVEGESSGFKKSVISGIVLQVNQKARVDITLTVGEVSQTVSVSAEAPLLNTDDATLGKVIDQQSIVELPLNNRSFMEFALLVPGVNEGAPGAFQKFVRGYNITANGARGEFNNYQMDGVDNNDEFSFTFNITPSIDAIQEFKVQTGLFSAEFGRSAGAVVNLVTRSGTNEFHGTLFEFLRNDVFDALNFFDIPRATRRARGEKEIPPYRQNQFGGSVGGPVTIPRVYNGKNKTFFFFNYDGTRIRQAVTKPGRIPTLAERSGDFRGGPTIYDPRTTRPNSNYNPSLPVSATNPQYLRDPFLNNVIPQDRFDPISRNIIPFWPDPNNNDPARNWVNSQSRTTDANRWIVKLDHSLGSKDNVSGRFAFDDRPRYEPGILPTTGGQHFPDANRGLALNWTHTVSPKILNEARVGYNRMRFGYFNQNTGIPLAAQIGIQGVATGPSFLLSFPSIGISGFTAPSDRINFYYVNNRYQFIDSLSINTGTHSLKMGVDLSRIQTNTIGYGSTQGQFAFDGSFTTLPSIPGTGSAMADFLLGTVQNEAISDNVPLQYFRGGIYAGYITDDWKVSQRLTLTLGLRYENFTPYVEKYDRMGAYDPATRSLVFPKNAPLGDYFTRVRPDLKFRLRDQRADYDYDNNNFAPRFGFAYRPFNDNKTVIRGGGGTFYSGWSTDVFSNTGTIPPIVLRSTYVSDLFFPTLGYNQRGDPTRPTPRLYAMANRNVVNPYIQQWSLNVQREITANLVVEAGYVGHHGVKLGEIVERNAALSPSTAALQPRRQDPSFAQIQSWESGADSYHNSFTLSLQQRYSQGLQFLAGYTWSKTLDTASVHIGALAPQRFPIPRSKDERGRADFDTTQRFIFNSLYDLPFGKGRRFFGSAQGIGGKLLEGWQIASIVTLRSGFPNTITLNTDNLNIGLGRRPHRVGVGSLPSSQQSPDHWFDSTAFVIPPFGIYGNAGKNILDGPGLSNINGSIIKDTYFREGKEHLEFRAEFFNLFNHPNFSNPGAILDTAQFGRILNTATEPRLIQFGLKLYF
ncbi:MAG: carboxypeptidase regulatory-like domain-containing protein [Acidobacteria bacterium]|nr:carboxypeptidase regulatory-like domain-containing protein [Acidobacteriota bacterium]